MVIGQGTSLQIGKETTWGTAVAATVALNYTSEGFKPVVDKVEEDSLIGSATIREMDILKESAEFDFSLLAKPENIGLLLYNTLGVEGNATAVTGATGAYKHEFTPMAAGVSAVLPSFTAIVNRHLATKGYAGCKIDSMKISAKNGDYMRIDFSGSAKNETTGSTNSALTIPALKNFRFAGATVKKGETTLDNVTSIEFNYNNNLDDGEQTTKSGVYGSEKNPQKRAIGFSLEANYDATAQNIHDTEFKTNTTCIIEMNFESPSEIVSGTKYSLNIKMPLAVVTDANPTVTGPDKMKLTISGVATESASSSAVTITLVDKKNSKYSA